MVLGQSFEIDCVKIAIRGQSQNAIITPYFSGPVSITGNADGVFKFRLYDTLDQAPEDLIRLSHVAEQGAEQMAFDADGYEGTSWTGSWFFPKIAISTQ